MAKSRVKVTVFKRVDPEYIFSGNVPDEPGTGKSYEICRFEECTEWIVEKNLAMPDGFCGWAWRDLYKDMDICGIKSQTFHH